MYRYSLEKREDVERIHSFYLLTQDILDYWQTEIHVGGHVDVRLTDDDLKYLNHTLLSNITRNVVIQDVEELLLTEFDHNTEKSRAKRSVVYDYERYNTAAVAQREMYRLASAYPNLTRLIGIGSTHGKRPLLVLEITGDKKTGSKGNGNKPLVWVDGGLHAREWITVASAMYFAKDILERYGKDSYVTEILDNVEFAIQPLSNPDGYAYSWNNERLWRKNRSPTKVAWCKGVDLNRNFDVNFGGVGASSFSCSEIYSGSTPFSENESQAMARYLASVRHKLLGYFSLHSYGQMWLTPLSYTKKKVADRALHLSVAEYATRTMYSNSGVRYSYGPSTSLLYLTSGDSSDWVYTKLNCSNAYGIELRDSGRYGFLLPESQITITSEEITAGLLAAVDMIYTQPLNYSQKRKRRFRKKKKKIM